MNLFKKHKKEVVDIAEEVVIEYYEILSELPLYNWDRYQNTNDNNWFLLSFNGRQTKIKNSILDALEIKFKDDFYSMSCSDFTKIQKVARIEYLVLRYETILNIIKNIKICHETYDYENRYIYIKLLEKAGFKIPIINTFDEDIIELNKVFELAQGIKTQIKILEDQVDKGISVIKDDKKNSLIKELIYVSKGLELGYAINPKETSVAYWIELCKMLEQKIKNQK